MKTKIRFVMNTLAGGGAEKVLVDLLRRLDPQTYEVSLVAVTGGVHAAAVPPYVRFRRIVRCPFALLERLLAKIVYKLPPRVFARWFLRGEQDFEVAYLEGLPTRFVAAKADGKAKRIAFVHCDISVQDVLSPFYTDSGECLREYAAFSKVCFVSEKSKAGFETTVGALPNGCVVHNVVDFDRIRALAQEPTEEAYQTPGKKLVAVGRLTEVKAYDRLVRIAAKLQQTHDFELWILGEGEERARLEALIHDAQVRSVRLLGYKENPYAYMRQADVFVCSSLFEGYSTVVTEAVALGLPVLTTDCAGMDEILGGGRYGRIVENSEDGLKDGLIECLEDDELYARLQAAVAEKSAEMTSEQAMKEYEALFA